MLPEPASTIANPFLRRLQSGVPVLFDGAMGTQLYERGIPYERCFEELNRLLPDMVQEIHRAYIAAGAEVIETNTFSANRVRLAEFGLADQVHAINVRGVRIAREAKEVSGESVFLAGSVSSLGQPLAPVGTITPAEAHEAFVEQIEALLEGGVDLLVLETFSSLPELQEAVRAAQHVSRDLPIVALITVTDESTTLTGVAPEAVAEALAQTGVAALGVNCGVGPQSALEAVARMVGRTSLPVVAMPNAGNPAFVHGRQLYVSTPEYFAEYTRRFLEAGVQIVGGCCGTSPRHIAAMAQVIKERQISSATARVAEVQAPARVVLTVPGEAPSVTASLSPLAQKLFAGEPIISVEVDPPRGLNPAKMLDGATMIKQAGADCVDIGDSPMARVRMGCIPFAALCQKRGVETLIHFTSRDRNLMALQSDLLGAHALGIRNVIALTGDPLRMGGYPQATGVWDVDSIGFIKIIKQLNQGLDWAGNSIGSKTSFLVSCAVNPMAEDVESEIDRYYQKVAAGADFAITQPLYDLDQLGRFLDRVGKPPIPTVVEIMPLQSYKHAEFCHNELAGVVIPASILADMRAAGEHGIDVGFRLAEQFLHEVFDLTQGVLLVPSFHRYEMVCELVRQADALRRACLSTTVAAAQAEG